MALTIRLGKKSALRISKEALKYNNLVYIAKANKKIKYPGGFSKIAYIGQTSVGIHRITKSAADRAPDILGVRGFKHLDFYVVKSSPHRAVRTWEVLERDLIIIFKQMFGKIPKANTQGEKLSYHALSKRFHRGRLENIIGEYSE